MDSRSSIKLRHALTAWHSGVIICACVNKPRLGAGPGVEWKNRMELKLEWKNRMETRKNRMEVVSFEDCNG